MCFTGKLCRNAAHAKRSQVFFSQVAKKKNIHTEELSSVCNHQRTKIPPATMCIIHRKNINFGCNLLQHTSVPKNILSVCNQQRTKISPPTPPQNPPCHNVIIHRRTSTLVVICYNTHLYRRTSCLFAINNERKYPPPPPPPPKTPPLSQCESSTEEHQLWL